MKKLNIPAIIIGLGFLISTASYAQMRSSIEQYGITWTFDKEYETGQFVNGDWWVVGPMVVNAVTPKTAICTDDIRGIAPSGFIWWSGEYWCISNVLGSEGTYHWRRYDTDPVGVYGWWDPSDMSGRVDRQVVLSPITERFSNLDQIGNDKPAYFAQGSDLRAWDTGVYFETDDTINGRPVFESGFLMHGSILNPVIGRQGFDSAQDSFSFSLVLEFPLSVSASSSLLSVKSHTAPGDKTDLIGANIPWIEGRAKTETVAVLTVLHRAPEADAFRPPYFGENKPIFRASAINRGLLPKVLPPQYIENSSYDFEDIYAGRNKNVGSIADQYARYFQRPWILFLGGGGGSNHSTENMPGYHREVWRTIQNGAVLLCSDLDSIYKKSGEIEKLLIPFMQLGIDTHYINITQTSDTSSSRWPTMLAGYLLGNDEMLRCPFNWYDEIVDRSGRMAYYVEDGRSSIKSTVVPAGSIYTGYVGPNGKVPAWRQTVGDAEHEHLDPHTEWVGIGSGSGGTTREAYRRINSPAFVGHALSAHLYGLRDEWNEPALFDYVIRWMDEDPSNIYGSGSEYQSSASGFINGMWKVYRFEPSGSDFDIDPHSLIKPGETKLKVYNNIIKPESAEADIYAEMKESGNLTVAIYDSKGKEVVVIWDGFIEAGRNLFKWAGQNKNGSKVGSGVYMVHMKSGSYTDTKKIVVVR